MKRKCDPETVSDETVDNLIDEWHVAETDLTLHEWLGWTWEEYAAWVEQRQ